MNGVDAWCSFYRANPHRFCLDYLNIKLKLFQQIILYMMNWYDHTMYIAARGQGKTFLVAVFCCVRCILYPGTAICIASKTRGQSVEVLTKIQTILMPNSANLQLEIEPKGITINQSKAEIVFRNTSRIFVVTANDEARHNRANINICDEFRMIPLTIMQTVLKRFLTAPRSPGYLNNPKYSHFGIPAPLPGRAIEALLPYRAESSVHRRNCNPLRLCQRNIRTHRIRKF